VNGGDGANQLHDDHGLAHPGAAKDTRLAAFREGRNQVDHFYAGLEDFYPGGLLGEGRRRAVDGQALVAFNRTLAINSFSQHIEHPPQRHRTHGNFDGRSGRVGSPSALQTIRGVHRHGADDIIAHVLFNFKHQHLVVI